MKDLFKLWLDLIVLGSLVYGFWWCVEQIHPLLTPALLFGLLLIVFSEKRKANADL